MLPRRSSKKKGVSETVEALPPAKQLSPLAAAASTTAVVLVDPTLGQAEAVSAAVVATEAVADPPEAVAAAARAAGCPHFSASALAGAVNVPVGHPAPAVETALNDFLSHTTADAPVAVTTTPAMAAPPIVAAKPTADAWPRCPAGAKLKKLAFSREQPNVDELLTKHASAVTALKAAISDTSFASHDPHAKVPYDDLWLLRFLLSNGEKDAEKAVRATLKYREENAALLARAGAGEDHPQKATMSQLSISEVYSLPTLVDEPVQLIRAGKSNVCHTQAHTPASHGRTPQPRTGSHPSLTPQPRTGAHPSLTPQPRTGSHPSLARAHTPASHGLKLQFIHAAPLKEQRSILS